MHRENFICCSSYHFMHCNIYSNNIYNFKSWKIWKLNQSIVCGECSSGSNTCVLVSRFTRVCAIVSCVLSSCWTDRFRSLDPWSRGPKSIFVRQVKQIDHFLLDQAKSGNHYFQLHSKVSTVPSFYFLLQWMLVCWVPWKLPKMFYGKNMTQRLLWSFLGTA